ncbi:unnamed protein product, partial [Musa banksii]
AYFCHYDLPLSRITLANAIFSTPILLAWHNYLCYFWFSWDENSNLYKCQDNFGSQERCWKGLHCCISLRCSHGIFTCYQWTSCALHCDQPIFKLYSGDDWEVLLEAITGYGLGGSSMALFGRVGGGLLIIFWFYSSILNCFLLLCNFFCLHIIHSVPKHHVCTDNVGDIAGMGSDLFGSYVESSCAALVVASISSFGINHELTAMLYPFISSMGIIVCLIATLFATDFFEIRAVKEIEPALKRQLIISTALMTVGIAIVSWMALPSTFTIFNFGAQP